MGAHAVAGSAGGSVGGVEEGRERLGELELPALRVPEHEAVGVEAPVGGALNLPRHDVTLAGILCSSAARLRGLLE